MTRNIIWCTTIIDPITRTEHTWIKFWSRRHFWRLQSSNELVLLIISKRRETSPITITYRIIYHVKPARREEATENVAEYYCWILEKVSQDESSNRQSAGTTQRRQLTLTQSKPTKEAKNTTKHTQERGKKSTRLHTQHKADKKSAHTTRTKQKT